MEIKGEAKISSPGTRWIRRGMVDFAPNPALFLSPVGQGGYCGVSKIQARAGLPPKFGKSPLPFGKIFHLFFDACVLGCIMKSRNGARTRSLAHAAAAEWGGRRCGVRDGFHGLREGQVARVCRSVREFWVTIGG